MGRETENPELNGAESADPLLAPTRRAQIEQRVQPLFRLAGDNEPARELMRMVVEYRLRQQP